MSHSVERFLIPLYALAATLVVFGSLSIFSVDARIAEDFFLRAWYIQGPNTFLFFFALILMAKRLHVLSWEHRSLQKEVSFPPDLAENPKKYIADKLVAPDQWIAVERLTTILSAAGSHSDLFGLARELSRRDAERLERSLSVVTSIRTVIPVIGFLGTVIGLSLGLLHFPDASSSLDVLQGALNEFAKNLSIAFNTTLLALVYMIILILFIAMVRQLETRLLTLLEQKTESLIQTLTGNTAVGEGED
ncbi:MotA/TolQ/ExbB proton channel family protein [Candidatus Thiosymbion oneisti]|uniref:MotA/TolQ/ExbB proton channel family protein n=1 Tax=Candidatus Thiosymbion oneisti TaxID=589554 RepID=UPI000ABDAE2F|nr:MotA/TolQ/ExbB proton channel family protein [Candidatus Thiosymbion oneisti]